MRSLAILIAKSGGGSQGRRGKGRGARAAYPSSAYAQRIVIKARVVRNQGIGGHSTLADHVDYVERDGVDKNGEKGRAFGEEDFLSEPTVEAFLERSASDRHHFRFIVSPEHAGELDLQAYTRELMLQAQADLGTELDWLAVEHHNTDNPHVHILVRGVDDRGADLVIAREYISRGLRGRAQEIATRELGPRLDAEIAAERAAQLRADRVTSLDHALVREAGEAGAFLDVRPPPESVPSFREEQRLARIARLHHLESLGLATEVSPGRWELDADLLDRLAALARRAELVAQLEVQAGPGFAFRDIDVYRAEDSEARDVEALVVGRGKIDELAEHDALMVAAIRGGEAGKVFRVGLSAFSERESGRIEVGQVVRVSAHRRPVDSGADRNILEEASAYQGVYSAERHYDRTKERWRQIGRGEEDAEDFVEQHLRRLEGHERRGLVHRLGEGLYAVPSDLAARLETLAAGERHRGAFTKVTALSSLTLKAQARSLGPTWLDGELAKGAHLAPSPAIAASSAEREMAAALQARVQNLVERGIDVRERALAAQELERLYAEELSQAARRLSSTYGAYLEASPARGEHRVRGRLERIEALSSAPHALIVGPEGFHLVPARSELAQRLGREVSVEIREVGVLDESRPRALNWRVRFAFIERERAMGRGR